MEWNPPGHGDIYTALVTSGMLRRLIDAGIRYAFVSNSDNLGAVVDESILGYFAQKGFPFMMEVTDRTEADSKGGHLARLKNGRLTLREIAQCPEDELDAFQDVHLYKYFNTNTIWINLLALERLLEARNNIIHLPMIRNPKTVDPKDDSTPGVYQIETAMGSAISVFEGASAIRVPRTRFAPVKKCHDLLGLWSDCYVLTDDYRVIQNPARKVGTLILKLDSRYYKKINQLRARFPRGTPSLVECKSLEVKGDILFGQNVVIRGNILIWNQAENQATIPDGSLIEKDIAFT
jgi:UTP--glucose-1-phosphate uridylyltransferase